MTEPQTERLLKLEDVKMMVGFGKTFISQKIKEGTFPKPIVFDGRTKRWKESEVQAWIAGLGKEDQAA